MLVVLALMSASTMKSEGNIMSFTTPHIAKLRQLSNKNCQSSSQKGVVLILALAFVAIFSSLMLGMVTMSNSNLQIASNQHKAAAAFNNAESGMEIARYWLSRVIMPAATSPANYHSAVVASLQADLAANRITNLSVNGNGNVGPVTLNAQDGHTFTARIEADADDPNFLIVSATGFYQQFTRTVQVRLNVETIIDPMFNYGIASKGPVRFPSNPTIEGVNNISEAAIYIESSSEPLALLVTGNANFEGDITIGNLDGRAEFYGDVLIGGNQGQTAIDRNVHINSQPVDFPPPDTGHFRQYATGTTITSATDTSGNMVLTNSVIAAGTDPVFSGNLTINGVLFVESPNVIEMNGNIELNGMIVAEGDVAYPGTDSIIFRGNFSSSTFPAGSDYDAIRSETGSSILAPSFAVELAGNFSSLGGVLAVSSFHISGNASALIKGTIVTYSENPTLVEGNPTLRFDRSGIIESPAGFQEKKSLVWDTSSWSMVF